jgi:hypothetical protein
MKFLYPLLTAFIFASCNHSETAKKDEAPVQKTRDTLAIGSNIYIIENTTDTNYKFSTLNRYEEADSVALSKNNHVKRHGDTLTLECDNGKTVTLVSHYKEDDSYRGYHFLQLNEDIGFYVLNIAYYEGSAILLVNKKTGEQIETIGPPVVSPNKEFFACGHCDIVAAFDVSGIELYKKENTSYKSIGLREMNNWGQEQMLWKNDTTLFIQGLELKSDTAQPVRIFKNLYIK